MNHGRILWLRIYVLISCFKKWMVDFKYCVLMVGFHHWVDVVFVGEWVNDQIWWTRVIFHVIFHNPIPLSPGAVWNEGKGWWFGDTGEKRRWWSTCCPLLRVNYGELCTAEVWQASCSISAPWRVSMRLRGSKNILAFNRRFRGAVPPNHPSYGWPFQYWKPWF